MTLCPPGLSFSPSLFPPSSPSPSVWPLSSPHPSASVSPPWPHPAGRPLDPSRVRAPSLLQVSVCSPRAAQVSGGLWGRRSPLRLGLQQSPSPQEACLENIPAREVLRRGRPAPRARGRHNDGPAHTQIHTRRPLATNTRAHAHSPSHPEPRGKCPDGRQALPGPESTQTAPPHPPSDPLPLPPPDTQTRPPRPLGPARRSPRPLRPGGLTWQRSRPRSAPLPSRLAPARPRGRCGGMRPARGGSALPSHRDTRGRGRGPTRTATLRPLSRCPAPLGPASRSPAPPETPPLAAKLSSSRGSSAPLGNHAPSLTPPQTLGSPAHHSVSGTP